jgi:surface antigen
MRRSTPYVVVILLLVIVTGATGAFDHLRGQGSKSRDAPVVRGDDYPYRAWSPKQLDPWGFASRNCTSFVAWRLNQDRDRIDAPWAFTSEYVDTHRWNPPLGDAAEWAERARERGYPVNATPERGAVAHWNVGEAGAADVPSGTKGHVAYVADVYADGTALIEEYHPQFGYNARTTTAPRYIHFPSAGATPPG